MSDTGRGKLWKVIGASSAGTVIEWYDFYIFGSLATILADRFFPSGNSTLALLSTLATFATGFVVRPFGAVVFGRMGDRLGRKYTFLVTLLLMGAATFAIGLLPTYDRIGLLAPAALLFLRLLQGLALGGEYGGAATYVAEHAPVGTRGFYTSFIQTTATLGLLLSLGVILVTRLSLGEAPFKEWGWRIPFFLSAVLIALSYYLRRRLEESPLFAELQASGGISKSPLRDSFLDPENRRWMLIAMFGAIAGQSVLWQTSQFYSFYYLQTVLKVDFVIANGIVAVALVLATPFFVVFGALSDRIGRKPVMMTGCLLATLSYLPIYAAMTAVSGVAAGTAPNVIALTALVWLQIFFATMAYGPIAAFLVELFPTRIRYTSISLPYHLGNGLTGGLVPVVGTAAVAATGNLYAGLYFPMTVAGITFLVGTIFLRDKR